VLGKKENRITNTTITWPFITTTRRIRGTSQLYDRADLDTIFSTLKRFHLNLKSKMSVWVYLDIRFNLRSVLLAWLMSIVYWKTCFWVRFCSSYDIILSYLVNTVICKLSMKWHLMRMGVCWLCTRATCALQIRQSLNMFSLLLLTTYSHRSSADNAACFSLM